MPEPVSRHIGGDHDDPGPVVPRAFEPIRELVDAGEGAGVGWRPRHREEGNALGREARPDSLFLLYHAAAPRAGSPTQANAVR